MFWLLILRDSKLKGAIERFLDLLEHSGFPCTGISPEDGSSQYQLLSGPALLENIKVLADAWNDNVPLKQKASKQLGLKQVAGKITIGEHANNFDGTQQMGCVVPSLQPNGKMPVGVVLGLDYLRGAKYLGVDGEHHPVSVEGVLANLLTMLSFRNDDTKMANNAEAIVSKILGGVERDIATEQVKFMRNSNGGFQSLMESRPVALDVLKSVKIKPSTPPEKRDPRIRDGTGPGKQ